MTELDRHHKVISNLRHSARKLVRELDMLKINMSRINRTPQHWHALIEISNEPNITIAKLGHLLRLSSSNMSRIVSSLIDEKLVEATNGADKREKYLQITAKGRIEKGHIDEFSTSKIKDALEFLTTEDQSQIIDAMQKYADALEKSRHAREQIKINTLSTSRTIRKQIIAMIENIQKQEFSLPVTVELNSGALRAEEEFYYNNSYNFWYATDDAGTIIASIGLKKINTQSGEIKKFFVAKPYRGRSVARKLLYTLLKAAAKHQFTYLYLGTVDSLQAAQRFYEKYGFSLINSSELPSDFIRCELDTVFYKIKTKDIQARLAELLE
ncbi:MAG: bifunctional helix-turn-helix transcriptional regulator/GNAT family N-acetyltransferase [Tatlockia sp.]|nr:bifunctional helix-turn-helix transcriptional regulator/GNAT family N-acetyltransferase [Tatlockia sp.]